MNDWLLTVRSLLHHNVPRFIAHIKCRGGVSEEEWAWLRCEEDSPEYPEGLFNRADEYLIYPKESETFDEGIFVLVKAIAIMSFVPGGVQFLGLQFCSEIENFVSDESET